MNKTKTNISVKTNTGSRRKVDVIAGDNGPYVSGDILDANGVKDVVDNAIATLGNNQSSAPEIEFAPQNAVELMFADNMPVDTGIYLVDLGLDSNTLFQLEETGNNCYGIEIEEGVANVDTDLHGEHDSVITADQFDELIENTTCKIISTDSSDYSKCAVMTSKINSRFIRIYIETSEGDKIYFVTSTVDENYNDSVYAYYYEDDQWNKTSLSADSLQNLNCKVITVYNPSSFGTGELINCHWYNQINGNKYVQMKHLQSFLYWLTGIYGSPYSGWGDSPTT